MSAKPGELPILQVDPPRKATRSRASLVRRARLLAWIGLGWHGIEASVAIAAGVIAGSVALVGFGADSLIELAAGLVVLWRLASARAISERRAQQMIAVSFYLLSGYVAVEAIRSLAAGDRPAVELGRDRPVRPDAGDDAPARQREGTGR